MAGDGDSLLGWGIVANVRREVERGEGGLDIRRGTKHFAPGAKVWVLPTFFEQAVVVGRHRGNSVRYITIVIKRRYLEDFRVRGIYSAAVMAAIERGSYAGPRTSGSLWRDKEQAEHWAARWNRPPLRAYFDQQSHRFTAEVDDPPPLEAEFRGRTYHLAHFNARRAWYSSEPPPREPAGDDL